MSSNIYNEKDERVLNKTSEAITAEASEIAADVVERGIIIIKVITSGIII